MTSVSDLILNISGQKQLGLFTGFYEAPFNQISEGNIYFKKLRDLTETY